VDNANKYYNAKEYFEGCNRKKTISLIKKRLGNLLDQTPKLDELLFQFNSKFEVLWQRIFCSIK
jgi:hypothetical protein